MDYLGFIIDTNKMERNEIKIDIDNYISRYSGYTKLKRLLFIADRFQELKGVPGVKDFICEIY